MGTRRSRHNKGRKPLYKEINRETLDDLDRTAVERAERQREERLVSIARNGIAPIRIPQPDPILADEVRIYLEARKSAAVAKETLPDHAAEPVLLEVPEYVGLDKQIAPCGHDLLLQMLIEKKVSLSLFQAGRKWQWDKESAVIQPPTAMDWSRESPSPYQSSDLSERQWEALRRRRQFTEHSGLKATALLDFLLEIDRGRADLMEMTGLSALRIENALRSLLDAICECFG